MKQNEVELGAIMQRLNKNIDDSNSEQAKEDFRAVACAFVELFVGAEPRLVDQNIPNEDKAGLFFKAIRNMGIEFAEAWMLKGIFPQKAEAIEKKLSRFKNLEEVLTRYSK